MLVLFHRMNHAEGSFDTVEEAIDAIAEGRLVIVTDDEDRENEGDLIMAASKATPETINMMIRYGSGIVCVPTTEPHLRRLGLNPMVVDNRESHRTAFTVSVDAAHGVTTGISAYDRTVAIRILANPEATSDQLVQPGHVFPLRARAGGVLERAGHTEAAVDLAILAGQFPAGVICELVNEDGSMSRLDDLIAFKQRHGLKMISIAQLIEYRHKRDCLVEKVITQPFSSEFGEFELDVFKSRLDGAFHFALRMGELGPEPTLVRVHSENILSDVFAAAHSSSRQSLQGALAAIAREGKGVVVYMSHPCGGLVLPGPVASKVGMPADNAKMDLRRYGLGAQILSSLGLRKIRLMSSTPRNVVGLDGYGLEIVEQVQSS